MFKIEGGRPLGGEIVVAGSKNTVLPFIAAALLTSDEMIFENVPDISDVAVMAAIAEHLGARIARDREAKTITISSPALSAASLDRELTRQLRASALFSGALLGRARKADLPYPGGDKIGARPLTTHMNALRELGAVIEEDGMLRLDGRALRGGVVTLEEMSVTATENTILAAVLAPGVTEIRLADSSPHIQELVGLLRAMGAEIAWSGIGVIQIRGQEKLHGVRWRVNPDEIEISGFAALAAATRSELLIRGVEFHYIDAVLLQLRKMGVEYRQSGNDLFIEKPKAPYAGFRIQCGMYPKLMSDHLPPFAVLATQAAGETLIHEWMYEGRLRYINELAKMGASAAILDPHRAIITGPTPLYGTKISGLDLRSGMTLVIAALVAAGETLISEPEHLDRGYERIDERLRALGADIERVTV